MNRILWITAALAILVAPAWATDNQPETVTVRGKTYLVIPNEVVAKKGFICEDIPPEKNGYTLYLEAMNAYQEVPEDLNQVWDYTLKNGWPEGRGKPLEEFLMTIPNRKAISTMMQSLEKPDYQRYFSWSMADSEFAEVKNPSAICILLPALSPSRQLNKMLAVEGCRLAHENQLDKARDIWIASMKHGVRETGGITLIEYLVGESIMAMQSKALVRSITCDQWQAPQLRQTISQLESVYDTLPEFEDVMHREEIFFDAMLDEMAATMAGHSPLGLPNIMNNISNGYMGNSCEVPDESEPAIGFLADSWRVFLPDRTMKEHGHQFYNATIQASKDRSRPIQEDIYLREIPQWDIFCRIMLPSLSRCSERDEITRTNIRMTMVAAAIRLYSLDNEGKFPETLKDLKSYIRSEYLKDGFSGKDLVYRHTTDSWILYSVGDNRVDDGGTPRERQGHGDLVIQYPAPAVEPFIADAE